jgi:hypothetical protein
VGLAARSPSLITDSVAYRLVPQCEAKTVRYECLRVARGLVTAVPTDRPAGALAWPRPPLEKPELPVRAQVGPPRLLRVGVILSVDVFAASEQTPGIGFANANAIQRSLQSRPWRPRRGAPTICQACRTNDHSSLRMCDCSSERVLVALCGTLRCAHRRLRRAVLPPHRARPAADHRTLHLPPPPAVLCARRSARIGVCTRTVGVHTRACACMCVRVQVSVCARACECHRVCQRASVLASVPCSKHTTRRDRKAWLYLTTARSLLVRREERAALPSRPAADRALRQRHAQRTAKPHPQLPNLSLAL